MQAKQLAVGMTVKYGNSWVLIKQLTEGQQKNGKKLINIVGTQLAQTITRRGGFYKKRKHQIEEIKNFKCTFKAETKVKIR